MLKTFDEKSVDNLPPWIADRVGRLVQAGVLKPRVAMALPLSEGALAHRLVENGAVKRGRLILTID